MTPRDRKEFKGYLHNCTDSQVQGVYDKEMAADRDEYAELAIDEADRRGIELDVHDEDDEEDEDEDEDEDGAECDVCGLEPCECVEEDDE